MHTKQEINLIIVDDLKLWNQDAISQVKIYQVYQSSLTSTKLFLTARNLKSETQDHVHQALYLTLCLKLHRNTHPN